MNNQQIIIRKKLDSNTIRLGKKAQSLIGKNVEITIREISDPKSAKKKWNYLGSVSLGKELHDVNIRDFAHEN